MPMTSCLADEILRQMAGGETASAEVQEHFDHCGECQTRLKEFSAESTASVTDVSSSAPQGTTPARIGKYVIVGLLDTGGQSVVYRAVHPDLHLDVIIKIARKPLVAGGIDRDRLLVEGRLLGQLHHDNVVRVYDIDIDEGRPFLAMEFIQGLSLEQDTKRKRYTPKEAAAVVATLAKAVACLHGQGIVHQDIKPKNIMIDEQRRPRLIDLGMARLGSIWSQANDGPIGGTLTYLAPEQARCEGEKVGPATDVFGLGGVLYYLLTGRTPNEGANRRELLDRARLGVVDRDALRAPGIPKQLGRICSRALAAEPAERPSARELAHELDRFCSGVTRRVALAAALLFPLILVGGWWWFNLRSIPNSPNPLRPGLNWAGTFYWASDPNETDHIVQLRVSDQRGDRFSGLYETRDENGKFAFRVEGYVHGKDIQWRFVEQLAGQSHPNVVKRARFHGTINDNKDIVGRYSEGGDQAVMDLAQVKNP